MKRVRTPRPPAAGPPRRPQPGLVADLLEEYGAIVRRKIEEYLRASAGGDAGYLYDLVHDYPARGGRALRSTLCIATARAFGASIDDALRSAVSLEILHNAFLVHDDIEDLSEERRGSPTLHVLHGVPIAINAGDAMAVFSLRPLIDNQRSLGLRRALDIIEEAERMARDTVEGQAIELGWRRNNAVDLQETDYLRLILKKTCAYSTIFPIRVGAAIGAGDRVDRDRLALFGFFVGAAFQIEDDLLNLVGDKRAYGKELDGDIWEGKRTLMLVRLLRAATRFERARLERFLALPRSEKAAHAVAWVRERMDHYGCLEYARQAAHGLAGAAQHEFSIAFAGVPDSRDKRFLEELPAWVLERS
jgi:geranylgeranyl diphosphate synthase type II